jgi:phosphotransacetylase
MAAQQAGLIEPLLLGPRADIDALARTHGIDLSPARRHDSASAPDHAATFREALSLIERGEAEVLMSGGLPTLSLLRNLMRALLNTAPRDRTAREGHEAHEEGPSTHDRADVRPHGRISHAFIADVPGRNEPLLITDAALNIQPSLQAKRDIAQNAIDLALTMGLSPRVAVLSAANTANSHLISSVDALALRQMAEQGQITGGIVDGPLPFDAAISPEAARVRHADSPVAGQANVLLVPNLETGDMLVKQLVHLAHADVAGIVLGAGVPVIIQSSTDTPRTRLASAALALLQARTASLPTSRTRT